MVTNPPFTGKIDRGDVNTSLRIESPSSELLFLLIKKLKLKATPIELQNKFENIYLKNRAALEQLSISKNELENLLKSVLQKVF